MITILYGLQLIGYFTYYSGLYIEAFAKALWKVYSGKKII